MFDLTITTKRLLLRPFELGDAPRLHELASAWDIVKMTARIPHPYPRELAEEWIATRPRRREISMAYIFAAVLDSNLVGCVDIKHDNVENLELATG